MKKHLSALAPVAAEGGSGRPNAWLFELARIRHAPWDAGQALRAALAAGLPWAISLATGSAMSAFWISFGALRALSSETGQTDRARLHTAVVGPVCGVIGFLANSLGTMPWSVTVATMSAAGLLAGIAGSYGALLSAGATQALLIACISIGLPEAASGWGPPLLYLSGIALYAALLGIETLCVRGRGRNPAVTTMLGALGALAARRAAAPSGGRPEPADVAAARRTVTASFATLGTIAMRAARQHFGRRGEGARLAALLAQGDALFVAIMAAQDKAVLQAAAIVLGAAAAGKAVPPLRPDGPVGAALDGLLATLEAPGAAPPQAPAMPVPQPSVPVSRRLHVAIDRLAPTGAVARSAVAMALCLGVAYAARWLIDAGHWYWIPLTVGLVMKPDLGSVFARAIQRVVGTVVGAMIGAAIVLLLPKGVWLAIPIAVFAGLMPAAAQRSYALLAATVTPVILILVSIMDPGPVDIAYCLQRVVDTAIGGAIALVFGYFIWPRTHFDRLAPAFDQARQHVADYVRASVAEEDGPAQARLPAARRAAYQDLMDMRTKLRAALAEPPPVSVEAAAWFPLIAAAERICDQVTAYAVAAGRPVSAADAEALARLAADVAATPDARRHRPVPSCAGCSAGVAGLFGAVERELQHMDRLRDDHAFAAARRRTPSRHQEEG